MDRTSVDSSMIREIGYDGTNEILEVQFTNGSAYDYHQVPPETYKAIMEAASPGRAFNEHIWGRYEGEKV